MSQIQSAAPTHVDGSCHCNAVRFSAAVDLTAAFRCNCTICAKVAVTVGTCTPSAFRLHSGEGDLVEYRFGPGIVTRFFCRRCGIHCFARIRPPEGEEQIGVNLNTLDGVELASLPVVHFDGRHDTFEPLDAPAPMYGP